jgi:hypothetical protein
MCKAPIRKRVRKDRQLALGRSVSKRPAGHAALQGHDRKRGGDMHARSITFAGPRSCTGIKVADPTISRAARLWHWISHELAPLRHRLEENMAAAEASGMLDRPAVARRLLG